MAGEGDLQASTVISRGGEMVVHPCPGVTPFVRLVSAHPLARTELEAGTTFPLIRSLASTRHRPGAVRTSPPPLPAARISLASAGTPLSPPGVSELPFVLQVSLSQPPELTLARPQTCSQTFLGPTYPTWAWQVHLVP